jgi:hypoxanthine-DNA glycosylase
MKYSFLPVVNEECVALILGTMPGEESLRQQKYYANPRNHFWKLIYAQYEKEPHKNYEERKFFLLNHKIALWDVLYSAQREGSLDMDIKNGVVNDFAEFFCKYPNIKYIFLNGGKAEELFKKHFSDIYKKIWHKRLPSSSPANTKSFEFKNNEWKVISEILSS